MSSCNQNNFRRLNEQKEKKEANEGPLPWSRSQPRVQILGFQNAAADAVDSCIKDHIMEDFLLKERAGVIKMHVLDFNEKLHDQSLREEGYEEGQSAIIRSMLKIGRTPKEISDFCNIPLERITKIRTDQTK